MNAIKDNLALMFIRLAIKLTTWAFTADYLIDAERTQREFIGAMYDD